MMQYLSNIANSLNYNTQDKTIKQFKGKHYLIVVFLLTLSLDSDYNPYR